MLQVKGGTSAYPDVARQQLPPIPGPGASRSRVIGGAFLAEGARAGGRPRGAQTVSWREGSRGELCSRFLALRVRPANVHLRRAAAERRAAAPWLVCEWPDDADEPVKYWLSNLPADTPLTRLVALAKLRWRIEHDYRELKDALGLDHFEGRSFRGWHHHVTLVSLAHGFLTLERAAPKSACAGLTLFQVLRELQQLVACWTGACPTCRRELPPDCLPARAPVPT